MFGWLCLEGPCIHWQACLLKEQIEAFGSQTVGWWRPCCGNKLGVDSTSPPLWTPAEHLMVKKTAMLKSAWKENSHYLFLKCMLFIHPCFISFCNFNLIMVNRNVITRSSGEMKDFSLVIYAGILQTFSQPKSHPFLLIDCQLTTKNQITIQHFFLFNSLLHSDIHYNIEERICHCLNFITNL